jgi:RNA-directed DNA polymerase
MMNGQEKSDPAIVAGKPANKDASASAEPVEPRAGAEGNAVEHGMHRTPSRESMTHGLDRIRQAVTTLRRQTQGGSPVRESRSPGSVRGACSNARPYRDNQ